MNARCKHGDLAVVINEYPECAANIGRVVVVSGPSYINREGMLVWYVNPISSEPYFYNTWDDLTPFPMSPDDNDIQHPVHGYFQSCQLVNAEKLMSRLN